MNKNEVITRLCALVSRVGAQRYSHELEHDCFCDVGGLDRGAPDRFVSVHPEVIAFIENAVQVALGKDNQS